MKPNAGRGQWVAVWLGAACPGLMPPAAVSAEEPKLRDTLKGHTQRVLSVAFSPDCKTLASGSGDKTIELWDMSAAK